MRQEQRLLQGLARSVAEELREASAPEGVMAEVFSRGAVAALADSGLWAVACPPPLGGMGGDPAALVLVAYELARVSASLALSFVAHSSVCRALDAFASEALAGRYLPALAAGAVGAFAVHEPDSGVMSAAITTRAEKSGEHLVVHGSKFFVTNGSEAEVILALVRSEENLFSVLAIDESAPGLVRSHLDRRMGLNGVASCEIVFAECVVPRNQVVGQLGQGMEVLKRALIEYAFFGAAAVSLGLAEACFEAALRHARERTIQGTPIGEQQAVRLMIGEMDGLVAASRALLWGAVTRARESPPQTALLASQSKRFVSEAAVRVADRAIQVCGGHGYCQELPLERRYRDARGLTLHYKTTEILSLDVAGMLLSQGGTAPWPT